MTQHDALLVDLDGTVYAGPDAIPGAVEALEAARERGLSVSYVTNNASRAPGEVSDHLTRLGLTLTEDDVVTSAQAGAAVLAQQCDAGAAVLVVGTEALADEIRGVGLDAGALGRRRPGRRRAGPQPGHRVARPRGGRRWPSAAERRGWRATSTRRCPATAASCPATGPWSRPCAWPAAASRRWRASRQRRCCVRPSTGRARTTPLVVGDRLDTDIAGGHAVEAETLLVLTGISTAADVLAATRDERPTYLAADLGALADLETTRRRRRRNGWRRPRRRRHARARRTRGDGHRDRPARAGRGAARAVPRVVVRGGRRRLRRCGPATRPRTPS